MPKIIFLLVVSVLLSACLKEPERVVQYEVNCSHCIVDHLDDDGVTRSDSVKNGFLLRFNMDVDQNIMLKATSVVSDPLLNVTVLVDTEVLGTEIGSGDPERATIDSKVPGRQN